MQTLSVLAGGAVGALARWWVGLWLSSIAPWATFVVNVSGAFGLALVATLLTERLRTSPHIRTLVGVGFFGAYTTFSTMAMDGVRLATTGRAPAAALYWTATLTVGLAAAFTGTRVARIPFSTERRTA